MRICFGLLFTLFLAPLTLSAKTTLQKTDNGWQMLVDDQPFFVKGFTWSHTPVGHKYDYNLFAESDDAIKAALKRDLTLIRDAGGNTLRHIIPLEWMDYVHQNYGLYFVANDYCGRYGMTIDGKFIAHTDYSDPQVRDIIKQTWRDLATKYKDAPGLLLHALGNENNYGLEWKSAAVENLPVGEQQTAKARHLYSLFNEVALEIKKIDPHHPVGIVNGDLQYLDLIKELCPDIDYLGVNAYRGPTYSSLFQEVEETLGIPVIFMETGCDAYHAVKQAEDQLSQAEMIHSNWIDIYKNTASNGGSGNCLGGLHFQWADEWWKHGQQYDLTIHNTTATWHHSQYFHDADAENNMNEEWFGVCAISREALDGAHLIRPRAAYFTLKNLWKHNPYTLGATKLSQLNFDTISITSQTQQSDAEFEARLAQAEIPYHDTPKTNLPATIYSEHSSEMLWASSGIMPDPNFIALNTNCTTKPHSGDTCLEIKYNSGGDWSGLQWQSPDGDWDNNAPGGFDLTGATVLKLWARGQNGGEQAELSLGGPLTGLYPNTAQTNFGTITLTPEWQEFTFPLANLDLRRIKNPLTLILKGNGFPYRIYLDDITFE
ncbi:MAG: hypothetical protein AAGC74_07380 [Verrucomicrobiota bacterium]